MTYDYKCDGCGATFTREEPISAKPCPKCKRCGKRKARRQISGRGGFVLKGSGWAADGYS